MSDSTITFLVLAVTVAVFVWDRLPIGVVAFGVALSLWATDVLTIAPRALVVLTVALE